MESTLSLQLDDISADIGFFLGYGRGEKRGGKKWDVRQQAEIDTCVRSGLRQFYFPPPAPGERGSYDWSFMKPVASILLASGASATPLPDDFGGMEGEITILSTQGSTWWPIKFYNEGQIRQAYAETPTRVGRPFMAAVAPLKGTTHTRGQRMQLLTFPLADQAYTLQFQYYVNADILTSASPYPLGGTPHAETILESCLAVAEERLDDNRSTHAAKFQERLLASISMDRRQKAQTLGPNLDRSDWRWSRRSNHVQNGIRFNGVLY